MLIRGRKVFSTFVPVRRAAFCLLARRPGINRPLQDYVHKTRVVTHMNSSVGLRKSLSCLNTIHRSNNFCSGSLITECSDLATSSGARVVSVFDRVLGCRSAGRGSDITGCKRVCGRCRHPLVLGAIHSDLTLGIGSVRCTTFVCTSTFIFSTACGSIGRHLTRFAPRIRGSCFKRVLSGRLLMLGGVRMNFTPTRFAIASGSNQGISLSSCGNGCILVCR